MKRKDEEMNRTRIIVLVVSVLLMALGLGCLPLSYYLTPAESDSDAIRYVTNASLSKDVNDYVGYPNLAKAMRLQRDVNTTHSRIQQGLNHEVEADNLEHSIHSKTTAANTKTGLEREALLFGPKGIIPLALSILGAGTLSGYIGLMRRKPGDVAKEVYFDSLDEIAEQATELFELVKGIEAFKKTLPSDNRRAMKQIFNDAQNKQTTQVRVAELRTQI